MLLVPIWSNGGSFRYAPSLELLSYVCRRWMGNVPSVIEVADNIVGDEEPVVLITTQSDKMMKPFTIQEDYIGSKAGYVYMTKKPRIARCADDEKDQMSLMFLEMIEMSMGHIIDCGISMMMNGMPEIYIPYNEFYNQVSFRTDKWGEKYVSAISILMLLSYYNNEELVPWHLYLDCNIIGGNVIVTPPRQGNYY